MKKQWIMSAIGIALLPIFAMAWPKWEHVGNQCQSKCVLTNNKNWWCSSFTLTNRINAGNVGPDWYPPPPPPPGTPPPPPPPPPNECWKITSSAIYLAVEPTTNYPPNIDAYVLKEQNGDTAIGSTRVTKRTGTCQNGFCSGITTTTPLVAVSQQFYTGIDCADNNNGGGD